VYRRALVCSVCLLHSLNTASRTRGFSIKPKKGEAALRHQTTNNKDKMGLLDLEWTASQVTIAVVTALCTVAFVFGRFSSRKSHPNEPTVIPPWIPFIGHLVGMALHGGRYVKKLG